MTLWYWENHRTEPEIGIYPRIVNFLGYCPYRCPRSFGELLFLHRAYRGLSKEKMACSRRGESGNILRLGTGQSLPDHWITGEDRQDIGLVQKHFGNVGLRGYGKPPKFKLSSSGEKSGIPNNSSGVFQVSRSQVFLGPIGLRPFEHLFRTFLYRRLQFSAEKNASTPHWLRFEDKAISFTTKEINDRRFWPKKKRKETVMLSTVQSLISIWTQGYLAEPEPDVTVLKREKLPGPPQAKYGLTKEAKRWQSFQPWGRALSEAGEWPFLRPRTSHEDEKVGQSERVPQDLPTDR